MSRPGHGKSNIKIQQGILGVQTLNPKPYIIGVPTWDLHFGNYPTSAEVGADQLGQVQCLCCQATLAEAVGLGFRVWGLGFRVRSTNSCGGQLQVAEQDTRGEDWLEGFGRFPHCLQELEVNLVGREKDNVAQFNHNAFRN